MERALHRRQGETQHASHVAVIEEGKLVGILSDRDLRKHQSAPPPGDSGRVVNSRSSEEPAPNAAGEEDAG